MRNSFAHFEWTCFIHAVLFILIYKASSVKNVEERTSLLTRRFSVFFIFILSPVRRHRVVDKINDSRGPTDDDDVFTDSAFFLLFFFFVRYLHRESCGFSPFSHVRPGTRTCVHYYSKSDRVKDVSTFCRSVMSPGDPFFFFFTTAGAAIVWIFNDFGRGKKAQKY